MLPKQLAKQKTKEVEKYLIDNQIDYYKDNSGALSITISNIPLEKLTPYWEFIYKTQKKYEKLNTVATL